MWHRLVGRMLDCLGRYITSNCCIYSAAARSKGFVTGFDGQIHCIVFVIAVFATRPLAGKLAVHRFREWSVVGKLGRAYINKFVSPGSPFGLRNVAWDAACSGEMEGEPQANAL